MKQIWSPRSFNAGSGWVVNSPKQTVATTVCLIQYSMPATLGNKILGHKVARSGSHQRLCEQMKNNTIFSCNIHVFFILIICSSVFEICMIDPDFLWKRQEDIHVLDTQLAYIFCHRRYFFRSTWPNTSNDRRVHVQLADLSQELRRLNQTWLIFSFLLPTKQWAFLHKEIILGRLHCFSRNLTCLFIAEGIKVLAVELSRIWIEPFLRSGFCDVFWMFVGRLAIGNPGFLSQLSTEVYWVYLQKCKKVSVCDAGICSVYRGHDANTNDLCMTMTLWQ